ncbi:hypothetical protein N665_0119s0085 [Sinapis alba]|nr:hypothetical protein N665_0119s0085 [Sinapis alba]
MKRRSKVIRRRQRDINICKSHEPPQEMPFDIVISHELWLFLICSKYFTNRFVKVSSSSPRLHMWLCLDKKKKLLLSSLSSPDLDVITMSSFVIDKNLTTPAMEGYSVSHVFHGLMCLTNGTNAQIYNTTTRQLVVLPDIEESDNIAKDVIYKKSTYSIGHDLVHDQHKVVCMVSIHKDGMPERLLAEHWVFTLGGGGTVSSRWRKISSPCPQHCPFTRGLTINGRMYYLALVTNSTKPLFVRFDISSEKISVLQKPEEYDVIRCFHDGAIEYDGRIAVLSLGDLVKDGVMKLWVMEDEETNRWSRKTQVLDPSQMNMVNTKNADQGTYYLRVHGTTRNGDVILASHNKIRTIMFRRLRFLPPGTTLFYVLLYNIQKNHLRKVEIKDGSNCFLNNRCDVIGLDDTENLMYL